MDALFTVWLRFTCAFRLACGVMLLVCCAQGADAANFRTRNFIIQAPTSALAKSVGESAEKYRDDLARYWTGEVLPPWPQPCPVRVVSGPNLAAQGVTTYNPAPVRDFQMEVIGTPERILDSVLPHEVTHTVLATYFGRPLPRWADEGICTTVEHVSERAKHEAKLREFLSTRRGIAMNQLFLLTEYPPDVLPMYAQGYSVCRFLIQQQGPETFIGFLKDYMQHPSWTENIHKHYGYDSLAELQQYWLSWVEAGSGPVERFVKADVRTPQTNEATRPGRAIAPATALAGLGPQSPSRLSAPLNGAPLNRDPSSRQADLTNSLVSANDRGRASDASTGDSWYHRRASGMATDNLAPRSAPLEELPPADRIAAIDPTAGNVATASATAKSPWAPPSVLSSGRYSAATPQGESSGSLPANQFRSGASNYSRGGSATQSRANVWR
ncbi:hypothetical protein SAMN06265222_12120 [Neorhodopirellula lusitana]|uniref:Peptidase MA-like domain-containing protein n=1 Tax=Neorhodopirellula lusitana TaxID=445327 RepID=A0ABY1QSH7_9BACT|nr:hypothetical protein [Neorhodopirellula lusitana]SMP76365.1 hypothetical protein SAMN06265222_12120 [Neorhodopirellula lusitana]